MSFREVLGVLSAEIVGHHPGDQWTFWTVEYPTAGGRLKSCYLYLNSACPLSAASPGNLSKWRELGQPYNIVVTPSSSLARNPEATLKQFQGKEIFTARQLLERNILAALGQRSRREILENIRFVEPGLDEADGKGAVEFFNGWFRDNSKSSMAVLVAGGGLGKTSVARAIAERLRPLSPGLGAAISTAPVAALLIEREAWQSKLAAGLSLSGIFSQALTGGFNNGAWLAARRVGDIDPLKVIIREGLLAVVFDGFDELCSSEESELRPGDIIDELRSYCADDDDGASHARILLTSRPTYWEAVADQIDEHGLEVYHLRAFTNTQRKAYFRSSLSDPVQLTNAERIASELGKQDYFPLESRMTRAEGLAGVPFLLWLIVQHVQANETGESPYSEATITSLLEGVCRREQQRHGLALSPADQMTFFEELFRAHPTTVPASTMETYLQASGETAPEKFHNHVFLARQGRSEFAPRFDILRVYFLAQYLARFLSAKEMDSRNSTSVVSILALERGGNTALLDWLANSLAKQYDGQKPALAQSILRAKQIIAEQPNANLQREAAAATLTRVAMQVADKWERPDNSDKPVRTHHLLTLLGGGRLTGDIERSRFVGIHFAGELRAYDFRGLRFENCTFDDVEFRNCLFSGTTIFSACQFKGSLSFTNCTDANNLSIEGKPHASDEARFVLDRLFKNASALDVKTRLAEEALKWALKKLQGDFRPKTIQWQHRLSGGSRGNPFREAVWDEMKKRGVIEVHPISGVAEGGIHATKSIRPELQVYYDNGAFGHTLRSVVVALAEP